MSYRLTHALAVQHGGPVICLADTGFDRSYHLFPHRPDARLNARAVRQRAEVIDPAGVTGGDPMAPESVTTIVTILGPIEQRAGFHDMCGGWSDGHDAIAERLCAALVDGNVMLVIDSPGGAAAGLQQAVDRVLATKAQFGRQIIGWADEMICSAAFWWAASVCDEIYGPEAMQVGSIGARSAHVSIAGAMEKAGEAITYFAAPGPGKIAFAPEFPLSELGKQRGERDTWLAFESFAKAVSDARGLTREKIVQLDADVLSGQFAVDADLVDGIATLEDVTEYTMSLGETSMADDDKDPKASDDDKDPKAAPPGDDGKDARAEDGDSDEDKGPPPADKAECAKCSAANDDDAKYCNMCGAEMPGMVEDDEPDKDARTARASDPPPADSRMSVSSILGLPPKASGLAIKTAVLSWRKAIDRMQTITETRDVDALVGAVIAHAGDAKRLATQISENRALRASQADRERMDLLLKLSAANIPGFARGELFVDAVDDKTGVKTTKPSAMFADMKLGTLRSLVKAKLSNAPAVQRNPFQPDASAIGAANVTESDRRIAQNTGRDPKDVAESRQALFATKGA